MEGIEILGAQLDDETIGWYPNLPSRLDESKEITSQSDDGSHNLSHLSKGYNTVVEEPKTLSTINWDQNLKYAPTLWWSSNIQKEKKEACRRHFVKGIEVRDLGKDHFLCGEKGVFATEKFTHCDIIGEYTGRVVDDTVNGHYVAALEDKTLNDSLGIDAGECGNEMRYINSYVNIEFGPNVTMRTVYMNTYPHILIVCSKDIEVGDELLLDYGKAYTDAYLTPKPKQIEYPPISMAKLRHVLPGLESDSSSDGNSSDDDNNHENKGR